MAPTRLKLNDTPDTYERCVEAKQMIQLLEELREEIKGMNEYSTLLISLIKRRYPRHGKLLKVLYGVRGSQRYFLKQTNRILHEYRAKSFDYEHLLGHVDCKPLPPLTPLVVSFEELMDFATEDEVWKDFLDG